ncbi:MAG TPA: glycoside hydrolase family 127 protein, partial [Thermoanaerobaculia bacterium]
MAERKRPTRREFLTSTAAAGALVLALPGEAVAAEDSSLAAKAAAPAGAIRPFPLRQVRLLPGPFLDAQTRNSKYLQSMPEDRLLHTFRVNAGLSSSAEPLGGWEKPDCELRGHFTGGHFLSACALTYAATGDEWFKARAASMVSELAKCQQAHRNGYLSAFPDELFDRLRNGAKVWAPFYTLHKILAGHLDVYELCGNAQALEVAKNLAGWIRTWTKGLSDTQMERILLVEFGGMNDGLYRLFAITGNEEHRDLAHRFDHRAFFEPLAARRDELQGLHVNTQIPKVIGAARRYELTGEKYYRDVAEYFWSEVTGARSYVTGNTSNGERWETGPGRLASELSSSTAECCCAYNLMKLTRSLFAWNADPRAADYYERALFNSRMGTQNPRDGTLMYYYPLASGYWKFYGQPLGAFWCCTGTGVEEFAKLADSIYFHDGAGLYVNLFIPSELHWPEKGLRVRQETAFPDEERTRLTFTADTPVPMALSLRIPWWATRGGRVRINGETLPAFATPSSYLVLDRVWKTGDHV